MRWLPLAVLSLLLIPNAVAAPPAGTASGSLTVNGHAAPLHHAYAYRDAAKKELRVLVSDKALDATVLAERLSGESSGDHPSLSDMAKSGELNAVELFINADGVIETVEVYNKVFGMPTPFSGMRFWYEPYAISSPWTGGRSRSAQPETFFKDSFEYNVTFLTTAGSKGFEEAGATALVSEHKAIDASEAARVLPASGGEEGAAYVAFRKNIEARNSKGILDAMAGPMKKKVAEEMSAPQLSESALGSWAFMESMPKGTVDVVGGVRSADFTLLELRRNNAADGSHTFGTARMVKEQGVWKVAEQKW